MVNVDYPIAFINGTTFTIFGRQAILTALNKLRIYELTGENVWNTTPDPDNFVTGVTKPDGTNTGIGVNGNTANLSNYSGDITVGSGQTVQNLNITGKVVLNSSTSILRNCRVIGRPRDPVGFYDALVTGTSASTGSKVEYCEIAPVGSAATFYMNGVAGRNIEAFRNEIYHCVDNVHVSNGSNVFIYGNYMHNLAMWYRDGVPPYTGAGDHGTDARRPGWTHSDQVQVLGGTNIQIIGNTMLGKISKNIGQGLEYVYSDPEFGDAAFPYDGEWSAAITVGPSAAVTGGKLWFNWMDNHEIEFQLSAKTFNTGNNWDIGGNRVGLGHPYASSKKTGPAGINWAGRYERMRAGAGLGTISNTSGSPNVYGDFASVNNMIAGIAAGTFTPTTGAITVGGSLPGTATGTSMSLTTRIS